MRFFSQRYRIFFFPGNSLHPTHSLNLGEFCIFFFPLFGKKKIQNVFFFFPGKVCKPLTRKKSDIYQKKVQKKVLYAVFRNFSDFFQFLSCIFFFEKKNNQKMYFFFPRKSLKSTHSHENICRKKKQQWKKNNIFTHSLDFCPKMAKVKLFPGNKKIR